MTILHVVPIFDGLDGSQYTASFWVDTDPAVNLANQAEVQNSLTDWLQDMYDNLVPYVTTAITAIEYIVYIHDILTGVDAPWFSGGWTFTGTNTSDSLPPQMAGTVSASLSGAARPAQKRLIPFSEAQNQGGQATPAAQAAMAAFGLAWYNGPTASTNYTYTPGVPSKQLGVVQWRDLEGTVFVRSTLGTVRSRKAGVGI